MELERIHEFAVFAESLKFADAAASLHMSQSSLSRHIHDMETELGLALVARGGSGGSNALTRVGKRYLELAVPLLNQHDEAVRECLRLQSIVPPARIQQGIKYVTNVSSQLREMMGPASANAGRFSFVSVDKPVCQSLDDDLLDFAFFAVAMREDGSFDTPTFPEEYGVIKLRPERVCVLVGSANPLVARDNVCLADIAASRILTIESSRYTNWLNANKLMFGRHGCDLTFDIVPDSPYEGGAFPIGDRNLVLCTRFYCDFYASLDVEDVKMLGIEGLEPFICPYLVYKKSTTSEVARQVIGSYQQVSE